MPWKLEKTCASYSRNPAFVFFGTIKAIHDFAVDRRLETDLISRSHNRIIDFQSSKQLSDISIKVSVSAMPPDRLIDPRKKVEAIETSIMALNMTWSITMAQNAMFYMNIRLLKELTWYK